MLFVMLVIKTLDNAQRNYAATEKEFLAVVFACDKFRPYIVDSKALLGISLIGNLSVVL